MRNIGDKIIVVTFLIAFGLAPFGMLEIFNLLGLAGAAPVSAALYCSTIIIVVLIISFLIWMQQTNAYAKARAKNKVKENEVFRKERERLNRLEGRVDQ